MNIMDPEQWNILQQVLAARQAAHMRDPSLRRNTVPGMGSAANHTGNVRGGMGAQSGASSPWDEVAGGGSTANALPPANPMVDDRRYYGDMADNGFASSMLGYGTALGTLAFAPPNPLTLALGLGGIGLGTLGSAMKTRGETEARRLGYQGN